MGAAVTSDAISLQYASEEVRENREIVLRAVRQKGYTLMYASPELRGDHEIALEAVRQYSCCFYSLPEDLKLNHEIISMAKNNCPRIGRVVMEACHARQRRQRDAQAEIENY